MVSTVYRQSATTDPAKEAIDPGNRLYWRKPMWRLEAETIRDRVLATSSVLNTTMFGPPVPIVENDVRQIIVAPTGQAEGEPAIEANERPEHRRSIYVQVRRSKPVSMLQQFDMPAMEVNCEKRSSSTLSTQALTLMNGDFVLAQAEHFARRLIRQSGHDPRRQVAFAWQLAFARPATGEEMDRSLVFLERQVEHWEGVAEAERQAQAQAEKAAAQKAAGEKDEEKGTPAAPKPPDPQLRALTSFCQALLGSSEFLYTD